MNKKIITKKVKSYFKRTYKNKLAALALITLGALSVGLENDGTFLVFTLLIGMPLFFDNENWIG